MQRKLTCWSYGGGGGGGGNRLYLGLSNKFCPLLGFSYELRMLSSDCALPNPPSGGWEVEEGRSFEMFI
jgi:hypothetical protein